MNINLIISYIALVITGALFYIDSSLLSFGMAGFAFLYLAFTAYQNPTTPVVDNSEIEAKVDEALALARSAADQAGEMSLAYGLRAAGSR